MRIDGIVLVHGASHSARCWDLVLPHLVLPAVAVDLPGRGERLAEFAWVTLDDCVRAVIDDADQAGLQRIALVGHSLGGVTITQTACRHRERVAKLIFVGGLIPSPGHSAAEVIFGANLTAEMGAPNEARSRATMGNDMTDEQWSVHWKTLVPEPIAIWNSPVDGYPVGIPTTYLSMADDTGAPPAEQMMANFGADIDHRVIQGGHLAMVTRPLELAAAINDAVNC